MTGTGRGRALKGVGEDLPQLPAQPLPDRRGEPHLREGHQQERAPVTLRESEQATTDFTEVEA
jgi:hypothetical protein